LRNASQKQYNLYRMGSSVILIAMVALWAMVLIPLMLKKNSQQFENKSVDRFKNAMSLISRTAPATVQGRVSLQVEAARERRKRVTLALTLLNISFGILVAFTSFSFWYFLSVFALGLTWLVLAFNASQKIQVVSKAVETIPEPPRNFKVLPNLSQLQYQYEVDPRREIIMDERPRPDMRKPSEVVLEERRRAKGA
jgi:hypothetical protein